MSQESRVTSFKGSLVRKYFLSRPFQLVLDFTIVPYGDYISPGANLTLI